MNEVPSGLKLASVPRPSAKLTAAELVEVRQPLLVRVVCVHDPPVGSPLRHCPDWSSKECAAPSGNRLHARCMTCGELAAERSARKIEHVYLRLPYRLPAGLPVNSQVAIHRE
jgi:hypothetical protein